MKNKFFFSLLLFVLSALLLGCGKDKKSQKAENSVYGFLPVKVTPAVRANVIKTLKYSGVIKGQKEVGVAPAMSSWVTKILVREGDRVKKGQVLAFLSGEQYEQAKAQYEAAEKNWERIQTLYSQNAISKQQYDQVEAAYKAAKAALEYMSKNTQLVAPFDGVVASVDAEEGEFFNAMMAMGKSPSVVTVADLSQLKIELPVSDRDINNIQKGQKALVSVDAMPDTMFIGTVDRTEKIADPLSGTYKVIIRLSNPDGRLRSGMYARVFIVIDQADSVISIPVDAIVEDSIVYVAEKNKAVAKNVRLGLVGDSLAQVINGINEGELVIYTGTLGLFDGANIKIEE